MSGTLVIHLVPGASRRLARVVETDVPITAPGDVVTNAWPRLSGGYLRLDYNSGSEWAAALLYELHARGFVRRYRWLSTWNWHTELDERDRPFASYLDRDMVINSGPMLPPGHKERPWFEKKRAAYERAAKELMGRRTERPWAHKKIRQMAEEAFGKHVIKREQDGPFSSWLCRRPNESTYWFRVIAGHNLIVFSGDLDELIAVPYTSNALGWMHGALGSICYFAEKVPSHIRIEQFDKKLVKRALDNEKENLEQEDDKTTDSWKERVEDLAGLVDRDFDHEAFYSSSLYVDEMPSVTGLSDGFYWTLEALRWFCLQKPEDIK